MRYRTTVAGLLALGVLSACTTPPTAEEPKTDTSAVETIIQNTEVPWDIAFLPGGDLLITERPGTLLRFSADEQRRFAIAGVHHRGEGGLLGLALHPDFARNRRIYLYLTTIEAGEVTNRVEHYRLENDELTQRIVILDGIPGAAYHDGGRLAFGPDGYLYITTGDAGVTQHAQDTDSLAGKILRLTEDGDMPADNPFGNAVYSYGHRNPQGLAWDDDGTLWSTEHGRSGIRSGFDELNRIQPGGNYGWPTVQGSETQAGMIAPVAHSGPTTTWAPASAAYANGSIFFGGLRGEALYEADISTEPPTITAHLQGTYGRLRDVKTGPDGLLYVSTSNRDGRGDPVSNDDRILLVRPEMLLQ